jgi:putative ABC transport system permease protein
MLQNYIKSAIRNLGKRKDLTLINILGLSLGMTCAVLILLHVQDEFGFERHHEKSARIYRIVVGNSARSNSVMGPAIKREIPEVTDYVRLVPTSNYWLMRYEDKVFKESDVFQTEGHIFDVFTFPLVQGNPKTSLQNPGSMVISQQIAHKYFGNEDPIGKVIRADNTYDYTITAVMYDAPPSSHIQPDFLVSFTPIFQHGETGKWGWWNFTLICFLNPVRRRVWQAIKFLH